MNEKTVTVVGASGVVGSHLVKAALARGYRVNGTLRDHTAPDKAPYLMNLPGAAARLRLFSADMAEKKTFDAPLQGSEGVFIASLIPTYYGPSGIKATDMDDEQGYREIIMPTVDGCLNILRAADRQGIRTAVVCSSTSSTNPIPPVPVKNEIDHWSDEKQQCAAKKYTSAAKTVMEKAAIKFADEHGIRLSIFMPTGLYGPLILPSHIPANNHAWLKRLIDGGEGKHKKVPNDSASMIHLEDLAALFLAAYEDQEASGRYYGVYDSWHWQDIYAAIQEILPDMTMPEPIDGEPVAPTGFDLTRRDSLGVSVRDIPAILRETIDWLKTDPFA